MEIDDTLKQPMGQKITRKIIHTLKQMKMRNITPKLMRCS